MSSFRLLPCHSTPFPEGGTPAHTIDRWNPSTGIVSPVNFRYETDPDVKAMFYHNDTLIGAWNFEESRWDMLPGLPAPLVDFEPQYVGGDQWYGRNYEYGSGWTRSTLQNYADILANEFQNPRRAYQRHIVLDLSNDRGFMNLPTFEDELPGLDGIKIEVKADRYYYGSHDGVDDDLKRYTAVLKNRRDEVIGNWNFDTTRWDMVGGASGAYGFDLDDYVQIVGTEWNENPNWGTSESFRILTNWLARDEGIRAAQRRREISADAHQNVVDEGEISRQIYAGDFTFHRKIENIDGVGAVESTISQHGVVIAQWNFSTDEWDMVAQGSYDRPNFKLDESGDLLNNRAFVEWAEPGNFLDEELVEGLTVRALGQWILLIALVFSLVLGGIFLRRHSGSKTENRVGNVDSETREKQQLLDGPELSTTTARGPATAEELGVAQATETQH